MTFEGPHKIWICAEPTIDFLVSTTPFGFHFDKRGFLLVADAFGENPIGSGNSGAVSSHSFNKNCALTNVSPLVPNVQSAACWLVRHNGKAHVTNNIAATVSIFDVDPSGIVTLAQCIAAQSKEPSNIEECICVKATGPNVGRILDFTIETFVPVAQMGFLTLLLGLMMVSWLVW